MDKNFQNVYAKYTEKADVKKFSEESGWKIQSITKYMGYFKKGRTIATAINTKCDKKFLNIESPKNCIITKMLKKNGDSYSLLEAIAIMKECPHEIVVNDLCATCGIDMSNRYNDNMISMIHDNPRIKFAEKYAEQVATKEKNILLKDKKLILLLDLDQTIIHTTNLKMSTNMQGIYRFSMKSPNESFYRKYYTKLRYGLDPFLKMLHQYYQLHIWTFGTRNYASHIVKFIDPQGTYFSDRILSRDELVNQESKSDNLKLLFPSGYELVVIVDDVSNIWNESPNLLKALPFTFFKDDSQTTNQEIANFTENNNSNGHDGLKYYPLKKYYLPSLTQTLVKIHNLYFKERGKYKKILNVADCIKLYRKSMLKGMTFLIAYHFDECNIIEQFYVYKWIISLGGTVSKLVNDKITHIIIPILQKDKFLNRDMLQSAVTHNKNGGKISIISEKWISLCYMFNIIVENENVTDLFPTVPDYMQDYSKIETKRNVNNTKKCSQNPVQIKKQKNNSNHETVDKNSTFESEYDKYEREMMEYLSSTDEED